MSKIFQRYFSFAKNVFNRQNMHVRFNKTASTLQRGIMVNLNHKWGILTLAGFMWPIRGVPKDDNKPKPSDVQQIEEKITEADQLFDNGQYNECYLFLNRVEETFKPNVEIMWRKSRVLYQLSKKPDVDSKLKHTLANEAYISISEALKMNDKHFAIHKWMSVILDLKCSCEGLKERIKNLERVKMHMLKAVELNPKDATTLYMLGEWCYRIADMPWYQRRIAQTLFATPPTSSFEEAISYFSKAEVVEPRFYSMNLLMLGKTYLKLGKEDIAKYYLNLALLYPARSNDDHQANKEAQEVLKDLK